MYKKILCLALTLLLISASALFPQEKKLSNTKLTKQDKELLESANKFYNAGNFLRALPIYKVLSDSYEGNAEFKYKTGICYLYKTDEKEFSIDYIKQAGELNPNLEDLNYNIGRAYHVNYKFDDAIKYFEKYIAENPPVVKKNMAEHYVTFCKNGEVFLAEKSILIIENVAPPVNTEFAEYVPVVSADQSMMIFTYKGDKSTGGLMDGNFNHDPEGEYYEDIMVTYNLSGKWTKPVSIGENINTKGHDASIALSLDGQKLFLFKSTAKDKGDIYMSELEGEVWGEPKRLNANINTQYWEGSVSISADEQTLYFASERPGGQGGRDIYYTTKQENGEWGVAQNIGSEINTKFGEDAPFIHPDGKTLFFSSEGHNSMGGYDIFWSATKDGQWSKPVSMAAPVNSTDNDVFYVLAPDGETGYYSSNRRGGYGDQDIYVITPGTKGEKPVLALAVGQVLLNSKPVKATIRILDSETNASHGTFKSNSSTGKYVVALSPGKTYKIAVEIEGQKTHYEYVDAKSLESYAQLNQDMQLFTEEYMKENNIQPAAENNLQKQLEQEVKKYKEEADPIVYETKIYNELVNKLGAEEQDTVSYSVSLGTYENPDNFDPSKITDIGKIESTTDAKGNTTYFIGGMKSMAEVDKVRKALAQKDAVIASHSEILVNTKGKTQLMQQYYAPYYSRKDYTMPAEPKVIKSQPNPEKEEQRAMEKFIAENGDKEIKGLSYKLEVAAVDKAADFKLQRLSQYGKIESKKYPDGKTRYTIGNFKTLKEVDDFKKVLAEKEPETAKSLITVFHLNNRKTLIEAMNDQAIKAKYNPETKPAAEKPKEKPVTKKQQAIAATGNPAPQIAPTPCDSSQLNADFAYFAGKDLNNIEVYNKLMEVAGALCVDGLKFTVQIGAYRFPQNFRYGNISSLGSVNKKNELGDEITRFTVGEFETLKDTEKLRQRVISKGIKDAWITATYNGKRMLVTELISVNFYGKAVN